MKNYFSLSTKMQTYKICYINNFYASQFLSAQSKPKRNRIIVKFKFDPDMTYVQAFSKIKD